MKKKTLDKARIVCYKRNMKTNNKGLRALTTSKERQELKAVGTTATMGADSSQMPGKASSLRLKRTFNQKWPDGSITKYWRVIGPLNCPSLNSDLSLEGLKDWNLI